MDNDFLPWIKYPDLSLDRLCILAELIRSVRHHAIALHEPENGDGDWCLGCRIYERTCFAIREAAKKYDWLGIIPGIPIEARAIRGSPVTRYQSSGFTAAARTRTRSSPGPGSGRRTWRASRTSGGPYRARIKARIVPACLVCVTAAISGARPERRGGRLPGGVDHLRGREAQHFVTAQRLEEGLEAAADHAAQHSTIAHDVTHPFRVVTGL